MRSIPPLLPEEVLLRVLRLARLDGMSLLLVAGAFALLSALAHDFVGASVGLLVAGGGALELHGHSLLQHHEARGINWLVGSQLVALVSILVYCAVRLTHVELPPIPDEIRSLLELDARQVGMSLDRFVLVSYRLAYETVAVVSILYQGGMTVYYLRRRSAVQRAFHVDIA
jgi:hypothetical protein